jgi:hypothetical protein
MAMWFNSLMSNDGGAPEIRTRETSMPSTEVPDIMPRTSIGLGAMIERNFCTENAQNTEKKRRNSRKRQCG